MTRWGGGTKFKSVVDLLSLWSHNLSDIPRHHNRCVPVCAKLRGSIWFRYCRACWKELAEHTESGHRMPYRKWRGNKKQLSYVAWPYSSWILLSFSPSLHFLWGILWPNRVFDEARASSCVKALGDPFPFLNPLQCHMCMFPFSLPRLKNREPGTCLCEKSGIFSTMKHHGLTASGVLALARVAR